MATLVWDGLTNREIAKVIETIDQVAQDCLPTRFDKPAARRRLEPARHVASHGGANGVLELVSPR